MAFECLSPGEFSETALARIAELYVEAGWISPGSDVSFLAPALRGSAVTAVVYTDGGELVGFGRALSDGCSDAYIQDVVVDARYRGRGLGRMLVRRLVGELRSRGVDWIGLVGEPGTEIFYEKLGFRRQNGYTLWKSPEE